MTVPLGLCWPCNEFSASTDGDADDVSQLTHQHEPGLLDNLRSRFARDVIYTSAGTRVLISLNPNRPLPNEYGEATMEVYRRGVRGGGVRRRPHLYAVGEAAFLAVTRHGTSSSVVVSGESGAGKTEASKHLLRYLSWRARPDGGGADGAASSGHGSGESREPPTSLAARVLHSTPVFEAFGNAATTRNHNSSRFGKHMLLMLTRDGHVRGARIATYLLERTRVATSHSRAGAGCAQAHVLPRRVGARRRRRIEALRPGDAVPVVCANTGDRTRTLCSARFAAGPVLDGQRYSCPARSPCTDGARHRLAPAT